MAEDVDLYTFSIKPKVRVGMLTWRPYVIAHFKTEANALTFKDALEEMLANYAKVSVSKLIRPAEDNEIPETHNIEDTYDVKLMLGATDYPNKNMWMTIPGCKPGTNYNQFANQGIQMIDGTLVNKVKKAIPSPRNVIAGGAV